MRNIVRNWRLFVNSYQYLQAEKINTDGLSALDSHNRESITKYLKNIYAMEKLARIQDDIAILKKRRAINNETGEPPYRPRCRALKSETAY
ncbi:MAG: hypothetical protein ABII89_02365 [Candidatus Omnitrophota bacterium]